MIEDLVDFSELDAHVRDCGKPFREAVLDYIRVLGERQGFVVRENSSVIKYGLTLGKVDVAWVDVKTVFFCEFATLDKILADAWLAVEFNPEEVVFVLSGKSGAPPSAVGKLIEESELAQSLRGRTALVDVAEKTVKSL